MTSYHRFPPADKPRTHLIVALRDEGRTLQEIGEVFGFTRERARQILIQAGYVVQSRAGCNVDPMKVLGVARRANSITDTARQLVMGQPMVIRCLAELGVRPALDRLWRWRQVGIVCLRREARRRELLEGFRALGERLGRTPTIVDVTAAGMNHMNYYHNFGSMQAVAIAADMKPRGVGGAGHITPPKDNPRIATRGITDDSR